MPVPFVTGSFQSGFFVPDPTQEDVDSGLPEWTLESTSSPSSEHNENNDVDNDDYDHDQDVSLVPEDFLTADEEEDSDSDVRTPPLDESDSGDSGPISYQPSTPDDSVNRDLAEAAIRPDSPELHSALRGLSINSRTRARRPRSRTQRFSPDFEIYQDNDDTGPTEAIPQPLLWSSAMPTTPQALSRATTTTQPDRVRIPPMTILPSPLEDYTPDQRHQIATLDLHRIIEQTIPRQMNLFIINDPPAQVDALLRADTARLEARRTAMGSFPPMRAALAALDEGHYRRNDSNAGLMAWLEDVNVLMAENQGAVEFNRRMWSQGGYESDENDGPDE